MWMLVVAGRRWLASEADRRILYLVTTLLWLLPYLGVRTSGEAMSGAMLCVGIALLEWRTGRVTFSSRVTFAILAGFAFGLCFEFRYPTVVMAGGAVLAYLRDPFERGTLVIGLLLGALAAVGLGIAVDAWGYGTLTFPFLSYVSENFILGKSNNYGTAPFYAYLTLPLEHPMLPVALFLTGATLAAWIRRPKNVLVWSVVPYVVLLSVTAHKETRFLFPLAPFLPFFVVFSLSHWPALEAWPAPRLRDIARVHGTRFLMIWNLAGLAAIPIVEFWFGDSSIFRVAEKAAYSSPPPQAIVLVRNSNQEFAYSDPAHPRFIDPRTAPWIMNPDLDAVTRLQNGRPFLALINMPRRDAEPSTWIAGRCELLHSSIPLWWLRLLDRLDVKKLPRWRELYRC
jgi:hypothetical protein